ncbi:MAG: hypothetical protein R2751_04110 [Bacteroidales bacterium]
MNLENKKRTSKIWNRRLVLILLLALLVVGLLFLPWVEANDPAQDRYWAVGGLALMYVAFTVLQSLRNPHYLFFSDNEEKLIFRFYPLSIFKTRKQAIEIPKSQFISYETAPFLLGTQQNLILYQRFRNKITHYPPISLSAVDRADRKKLFEVLDGYKKKV